MPVPSVSEHPRCRAIRERRVRGRIENALSAVAGWLAASEENGRPGSHPLRRDELDQIVRLLDTVEAAVSRTMEAGWRARFAPGGVPMSSAYLISVGTSRSVVSLPSMGRVAQLGRLRP